MDIKKLIFEQYPEHFLKESPQKVKITVEMLREAYAIGRRDGADELARRILEVLPGKNCKA